MYEQNQTQRRMLICILLLYRLDGWINTVSFLRLRDQSSDTTLHPIFLKAPALS